MKNFLADLKRRRVYRIALAYAAVAWMVLGVADMIFPLLGFTDQALRLVLFIAALGFPVAMILAWVFDYTPDGFKRTEPAPQGSARERLSLGHIIQAVLAMALVITVGYLYIDRLTIKEQLSDGAEAASVEGNSIAVLPFVNMSDDADNDYFSDGISEELLHTLANIRGLRVAARTSSFYFKGRNESAAAIGRKLGVASLLEGSVRKSGDLVRITVQLINTANGYHLWSQTYDGFLRDIFTLQGDIAKEVVRAITPMLLAESELERETPTANMTAYTRYLQGRALLRQPHDDTERETAQLKFEQAIKEDPEYAEAYAGLCDALLARYIHSREKHAFAAAERACHRALTRQSQSYRSWEVHLSLGALYRAAGDTEQSLAELEKADQSRPESVAVYQQLGKTYAAGGQPDRAEDYFKRAIKLDRADWESHLALGNFYYSQQDHVAAAREHKRVLAIVPGHVSALIGLGSALYMQGKQEQAEQAWREAEASALDRDRGSLGVVYTNLGLAHYYQKQYDQAIAMQNKAIEMIAGDHKVWGRLAESYRANGQPAKAASSYATAIELAEQELTRNPIDWETLGLLGVYQGFTGHPQAARDYKQKMLAQNEGAVAQYFAGLIDWACEDNESAFVAVMLALEKGLSPQIIANDPDLAKLETVDQRRFQRMIDQEGL